MFYYKKEYIYIYIYSIVKGISPCGANFQALVQAHHTYLWHACTKCTWWPHKVIWCNWPWYTVIISFLYLLPLIHRLIAYFYWSCIKFCIKCCINLNWLCHDLHWNGFLVATFNVLSLYIYMLDNLFQAFQLEKMYILQLPFILTIS